MEVEIIKNYSVCFTGHRIIPPEELDNVSVTLEKIIVELIKKGYIFYAAGGALGFDTLAAKTVLRLRESFTEVRLHLVLPCQTQTRGWNEQDIAIYENIKAAADNVTFTSREYTKGCMFKRNRHLVDISSICICYLRKKTGGTAYTVKYAEEKALQIIKI